MDVGRRDRRTGDLQGLRLHLLRHAADGTVDGPYTDLQAGGAVASHNPQPTVTCTQTASDGNGGTVTLDIIGFFAA